MPALAGGLLLLWAVSVAQTSQQATGGLVLPDGHESDKKPDAQRSAGPAISQKVADQSDDYRLRIEANLVVLHATVLDKNDKPITDLAQGDFRVFENDVEQKLKIFKREDIPVSVGIIVDNSGSMRDKRRGVNAAALRFVRTSNPMDEVFIVNFNDEAYLDADFTDNIKLLNEGLEKIDARGGTALYDTLAGPGGALDHLVKKGTRDKKVLLIITDGEDNASRLSLEQVVKAVQHSNVLVYTVGLLGDEGPRSTRRAKRALEAISKASGGAVYFPRNPDDVNVVATQISNDIRNQFVLAYTPTNLAYDGSYRKVEVRVSSKKYSKLFVRTRTGYYAKNQTPSS
jgi:Ca-activated chloride channel family protein